VVRNGIGHKGYASHFKQVSGFSFEDYCAAVHNHGNRDKNPSSRDYYTKDISPDIMELMWMMSLSLVFFNI
jgi:hypothetical protein